MATYSITANAFPSSGTVFTSTASAIYGTSNNYTISMPYSYSSQLNVTTDPKLTLNGEDADVILNGKSVKETLDRIEERLALISPNLALEQEWEELRSLGDQYRSLEATIKEKMKVWDILKRENDS